MSISANAIKRARKLFKYYEDIHYNACSISADELLIGGIDFFKKLNKKSNIIVSLNTLDSNDKPIFLPYKIKKIKGLKVAIIGLTEDTSITLKNIKIQSPFKALKKHLSALVKKSDIIICLTSLNRQQLKLLLAQFPQINIIISSGIGMPTYVPIKLNQSLIVSSHPKGKSIGLLKLFLDEKKKIKDYSNNIIMLKETNLIGNF